MNRPPWWLLSLALAVGMTAAGEALALLGR